MGDGFREAQRKEGIEQFPDGARWACQGESLIAHCGANGTRGQVEKMPYEFIRVLGGDSVWIERLAWKVSKVTRSLVLPRCQFPEIHQVSPDLVREYNLIGGARSESLILTAVSHSDTLRHDKDLPAQGT